MDHAVKIIECPRDAWQGLVGQIPAARKAAYLQQLIVTGFRHIDAVSFVSPHAVPQMADAETVLSSLQIPRDVELIGIVVNERGAERAVATGRIQTIGFPYSISPSFLERNQHQTAQQARTMLQAVAQIAERYHVQLVAYISMAYGNPYGDPWSVPRLLDSVQQLQAMGVTQISLADTVGAATAEQISRVLDDCLPHAHGIELGVHLHASPSTASIKVRAAYTAGCRRFDSALGGLGGCPFAQDVLVGNLATETLLATLQQLGATIPALRGLDDLRKESNAIATQYSAAEITDIRLEHQER